MLAYKSEVKLTYKSMKQLKYVKNKDKLIFQEWWWNIIIHRGKKSSQGA